MKYLKALLTLLGTKPFWSAALTLAGTITMTFWGKQVVVSGDIVDAVITIVGCLSTAFGWGLAYTSTAPKNTTVK